MDVKGARALSERLAEAARAVDPAHAKAMDSEDSDGRSKLAEPPGDEDDKRRGSQELLTHLRLATPPRELLRS
jgi:hypothetical protein